MDKVSLVAGSSSIHIFPEVSARSYPPVCNFLVVFPEGCSSSTGKACSVRSPSMTYRWAARWRRPCASSKPSSSPTNTGKVGHRPPMMPCCCVSEPSPRFIFHQQNSTLIHHTSGMFQTLFF